MIPNTATKFDPMIKPNKYTTITSFGGGEDDPEFCNNIQQSTDQDKKRRRMKI
jgi:hypothetical protein